MLLSKKEICMWCFSKLWNSLLHLWYALISNSNLSWGHYEGLWTARGPGPGHQNDMAWATGIFSALNSCSVTTWWISLGAVARSEASSLGMQAAPSSIPTSGTFFCGDLVMKTFLRPFSLFRWFKKRQLLVKECALSTGKLPRRLAQEQCG